MSIVNRRNAVIGWVTWKGAKFVAKEKARKAVPAVEDRRPNKPAVVAAGAAALAGSVLFWKARKRAPEPEPVAVGDAEADKE
jgi:hypothetical protein